MLQLKNIVKDYVNGDNVTHALKGLTINFRKSEFVSILGPSGCGKTTTLNIIGGLDRYTSGDLVIEGRSTKNYSDRDWDTYRNHSIGFVFQTYNLISHLSILGNVELALTIGGISKKGRQERALKALEKVGLAEIAKKKPNQLSGGQMQRVAIARALVNDPEILLADEPTGALDSETSVQIMDLLKEVAADRLVIMVTHNPDLANKYSSRIITMKDGELLSDSNPYDGKEEAKEVKAAPSKKSKMSLPTAFSLSSRNLIAKLKRTLLVCFAGSIGIIGVSTVLAVSTGVTNYVRNMQDDLLSGNPVTISKNGLDINAMLEASSDWQKAEAVKESHRDGYVDVDYFIEYLAKQKDNLSSYAIKNEITPEYVDYVSDMPKDYYGAMLNDYGINTKLNIFTNVSFTTPQDKPETIENIDHVSLQYLIDCYTAIVKTTSFGEFADMISMFTNAVSVAPNDNDYILSQYDILSGDIAKNDNEMMIVVSKDTKLRDIFLGQTGFYSQDEFVDVINRYATGDTNITIDKKDFSYDELLGKTGKKFYYHSNNEIYEENHTFDGVALDDSYKSIITGILTDSGVPATKAAEQADELLTSIKSYKKMTEVKYKGLFEKEESSDLQEIKVTGILQPKERVQYGCLNSGFIISNAFQKKLIQEGMASEIAAKIRQLKADYEEDESSFKGLMVPLEYRYAYKDIEVENPVPELIEAKLPQLKPDDTSLWQKWANIGELILYFMGGDNLKAAHREQAGSALTAVDLSNAAGGLSNSSIVKALFGDQYSVSSQLNKAISSVGGSDLPQEIAVYPHSFDDKYLVTDYLDRWNGKENLTFKDRNGNDITVYNKEATDVPAGAVVRQDIKYTDNLEVIISLINMMIQIVTIALVAFTSLSLVVSTVMIGIITYVSVVERVKEIGIIRSLGGRKLDVSNLFNVETFLIGLTSGVFGIAVTYGLCGILNLIIASFSSTIGAIIILPWHYALIIIAVSIGLTLISGLIPARIAAHKDPVVALRTGE